MTEEFLEELLGGKDRKEISYEEYEKLVSEQIQHYRTNFEKYAKLIKKAELIKVPHIVKAAKSALEDMAALAENLVDAELQKETLKFYISEKSVFYEEYTPIDVEIQKQEEKGKDKKSILYA